MQASAAVPWSATTSGVLAASGEFHGTSGGGSFSLFMFVFGEDEVESDDEMVVVGEL